MSETSDATGKGGLNLTRAEVSLLAHALNSTRLGNYSPSQKELLPTLGRKLSEYLAETEPYKYVRKTEPKPKPPKKLVGFQLTRAPGSEWHKFKAALGNPLAAAAANSPIE